MMNFQLNRKQSALVMGISIVLMAVLAGIAFGYAHTELLTLTTDNVAAAKSLLQLAIISWIGIALLDLLASVATYFYFRSTHRGLAIWAGAARLVYTCVLTWAIGHLMQACGALSGEDAQAGLDALHNSMAQFETLWSIGLIGFGVHLLLLGLVAIKARVWYWGQLLVFAGICYSVLHTLAQLGFTDAIWFQNLEMVLGVPMAIAELGLGVWLLVKGWRR